MLTIVDFTNGNQSNNTVCCQESIQSWWVYKNVMLNESQYMVHKKNESFCWNTLKLGEYNYLETWCSDGRKYTEICTHLPVWSSTDSWVSNYLSQNNTLKTHVVDNLMISFFLFMQKHIYRSTITIPQFENIVKKHDKDVWKADQRKCRPSL